MAGRRSCVDSQQFVDTGIKAGSPKPMGWTLNDSANCNANRQQAAMATSFAAGPGGA